MDRSYSKHRKLLICVVLGAATIASYWTVGKCDFINFDDPEYVTENSGVNQGLTWESIVWAFGTGYAGNWHPLTWISHMLDVQLFGLNPAGHHLTNLLLHLANSLLLFLVLQRMTRETWRSAFVAGLFALHPLHVESVAWISERKDVLSAFFFILTLWAYSRYAESKERVKTEAPTANIQSRITHRASRIPYVVALSTFALGLMSKPMLVTLPFVLLLLDYWPLGRLKPSVDSTRPYLQLARWKRLFLEKLPFLVLAFASSAVTFWVQRKQGAVSSISSVPLDSRIMNAISSYLKYLWNTVWPVKLAIFYPHPGTTYPHSNQWPVWQIILAGLVLLLISILVLRLRQQRPYLAVGWFWFAGMLVPVIGLVQVGAQAMADRYMYLPLIGLSIAMVWAIAEAAHVRPIQPGTAPLSAKPAIATRAVLATGAFIVLALCGVLTATQVRLWRDSITLFEYTLSVTAQNATAHFDLGAAYEKEGKLGIAMSNYRAALRLNPGYSDARYNLAHAFAAQGKLEEAETAYRAVFEVKPDHVFAHNNLGNVLLDLGRRDEAKAQYAEVVRLKPDYPAGHNNLGKMLLDDGNVAEASKHFSEAVRLKRDYAEARSGLALTLALQGKYQESLVQWREVLKHRPNNAEVHFNYANVLTELGKLDEAKNEYATALRLQPDLAQKNLVLAESLFAQGKLDAAHARFVAVTRLKPNEAEGHQKLGLFLAQQGKTVEAAQAFATAVRLKPDDAQAHYNLGLAEVVQGHSEQAIAHFRDALRLKPDWPVALNDLAWILATHPKSELRDGVEAVRLAQRACELAGETEPRYWGTLDAAYAEAAKFDEAIRTAEKTNQLAIKAGQQEIANAAQQRLALYRTHQPFRTIAEK